ncbi:MAG: S1 RNA-binding domain-containing protein [Acidimicrobiales bacterium]
MNAIQQETGADISVDDDGAVGIVSIGSTDGGAVAEAQRQIELILHPPTAELGTVYDGVVVNITKFGAFVNILPGRDGLVHISKLGAGKRIDRVEDVLNLGDPIKVRVDDIDQNGKVSLTPVGDDGEPLAGSGGGGGGGGATATGTATRAARGRPCRSRTPSTKSCAASSATSVRPARVAAEIVAAIVVVAAAARRWPWSQRWSRPARLTPTRHRRLACGGPFRAAAAGNPQAP